MYSPFGFRDARQRFGQQRFNQDPYNFKGLEDRLGKLETGIAGLTEQFGNFQMPGQETVNPEYMGTDAPEPLAPATPTGGISSLPESQPSANDRIIDPSQGQQGQELSVSGPLSLTQKLRNEYLLETEGPLTMGQEWDARAKEMGFDFRKQVRQGHKGRLSGGWTGTGQGPDQFNKLFEEAGGVLDRPEQGAAARYGEGFTSWLGDKGYEVYTEPQQEWMTQQQGLAGFLGGRQSNDYIPHLSQYAMTAEEMKDPEGTLKARRDSLYQPSGNDVGGLPPGQAGYLEGPRGGIFGLAEMSGAKYEPGIQQEFNPYNDPSLMAAGIAGQPSGIQQLQPYSQALQAGVGALQGPTQQKIKGYMT